MALHMLDVISNSFSADNAYFNRVLAGLKFVDKDVDKCTVTYRLTVTDSECNALGNCHGGYIATAVDVVSTLAVFLADSSGRPSVSVDMSVSYLKAIPSGTTVDFVGAVEKTGRTLAFLTCMVRNASNAQVLYASGRQTKMFVQMASL
jgi:acyl-coenzyme A thioesterase 13